MSKAEKLNKYLTDPIRVNNKITEILEYHDSFKGVPTLNKRQNIRNDIWKLMQSFADEQNKELLNAMVEKSKNYSIKPLAPYQSDFYKGAKWMKEELEKALNQQALNKESKLKLK